LCGTTFVETAVYTVPENIVLRCRKIGKMSGVFLIDNFILANKILCQLIMRSYPPFRYLEIAKNKNAGYCQL